MQDLSGKHIVLGLTGGIACYKSAELCRLLVKAGATVQVVMTEAATQFITPVTMQALSGRPVYGSQWDAREPNNMPHINLSREADAIVLAPASADFIARLVQGRADELLSLMCLARPTERVPLLIAPAMNREMWSHPATQRNLQQVAADGATVLGVGSGWQACGETGDGRMLEPAQLLEDITAFFQPKLLAGQQVLVTAGPTFEALDPIRGITNHSSGKMGFAIARAARDAGAEVTLVAGPVHLPTPRGVRRIDVTSAQNMLETTVQQAQSATIFIATAAVADWRPAAQSEQKIKKDGSGRPPVLHFVENADILLTVAQGPRAQGGQLFCVGFAAESENLVEHAKAKRARKGIPLLVGNIGPLTFGQDDNALLLVDANGVRELPRAPKLILARELVTEIAARLPNLEASMNPQWNTPPDGDFAGYVERLSAQAALPKRAPQQGEHGLDVGMTPSPSAQGGEAAVQHRASSNGDPGEQARPMGALMGKALLGVGGLVLLILWMAGVPAGILFILAAGGLWLAHQLRQGKVPGGGVAKWQKVLEEAARKQREQQRRQSK